ncbi:MAG TPA: hypothetical protein VIL55_01680 [Naasia sp.]
MQPAASAATVLELAGNGWEVREALGDTWEWYLRSAAQPVDARNNAAEAADAVRRAPGWLPARVPGSVIGDLQRAGEIIDPRVARNSRAAEWTADRHWVHRCAVDLPDLEDGQRAVLELDGVDPGGRVFWDGEQIGEVHGLYHPACIELPPGGGLHTLAVVLDPVPESEPQVGWTERVRIHSPRMNYGWDFCPRFPHQGIWKGVRIRIGRHLLGEVTIRADLEGEDGVVTVTAGRPVRTEVRAPDGTLVASGMGTVRVQRPELWHPVGLGPQTLYDVRVATADDERTFRVGFRTAEFVANPGAPEGALSYTARINGRVVPLVGWNWVPGDAQFGELTPERLAHLIALARDSGARLLRVWGGGLIETEAFYTACDEAGLLVWQEFSQSSSGAQSAPAEDQEFVDHLRAEAEAVVPVLAAHPSLLLWGGGNELDAGGVPLDETRSPALAALRDVVRALDPGRHWLPTSPTGPAFHNRLDVIERDPDAQHDVHGPWEHQGLEQHPRLYNAGASLAHTEFGVEGMTNRRALDALVPAELQEPADRTSAVYRHLGEWWNNAELVGEVFGGRIGDLATLRRASQWLQATGLAYAVEADRRRAPRCSMVLPWQLNESFPNAWCTSAVDFLGEPKPAYWAVARAFARDRVTIRVDASAWAGRTASAEAWLWSEGGRGESRGTLRALSLTGDVLAEQGFEARAVGDPRPVGALAFAAPPGLFLWAAEWEGVDREVVVATGGGDLAELLELPAADIEVTRDRDAVQVRHVAGPAVLGLRLADARPAGATGFAVATGDPRPLLPGETRSFRITGDTGAPGEYTVESWNTRPIPVPPASAGAPSPR